MRALRFSDGGGFGDGDMVVVLCATAVTRNRVTFL